MDKHPFAYDLTIERNREIDLLVYKFVNNTLLGTKDKFRALLGIVCSIQNDYELYCFDMKLLHHYGLTPEDVLKRSYPKCKKWVPLFLSRTAVILLLSHKYSSKHNFKIQIFELLASFMTPQDLTIVKKSFKQQNKDFNACIDRQKYRNKERIDILKIFMFTEQENMIDYPFTSIVSVFATELFQSATGIKTLPYEEFTLVNSTGVQPNETWYKKFAKMSPQTIKAVCEYWDTHFAIHDIPTMNELLTVKNTNNILKWKYYVAIDQPFEAVKEFLNEYLPKMKNKSFLISATAQFVRYTNIEYPERMYKTSAFLSKYVKGDPLRILLTTMFGARYFPYRTPEDTVKRLCENAQVHTYHPNFEEYVDDDSDVMFEVSDE